MVVDKRSLNGTWRLTREGEDSSIPAPVPGEVHMALQEAGLIEDPFYRENERDQFWIGESNWIYERTITLDEDALRKRHHHLRCEGLDTYAEVRLNGVTVGQTRNMFRAYEWDVKPLLVKGENNIRILFRSVLPTMREKQKQRELFQTYHVPWEEGGRGYIRKEQCNFGWDWGPVCVTCGIWRDISLISWEEARLGEPEILQDHIQEGAVKLRLEIPVEAGDSPLQVESVLSFDGEPVIADSANCEQGKAIIEFHIEKPHLWWPNGMGEQCLYDLEIQLQQDETVLHSLHRRIGLRTVELITEADEWGQSFVFAVNGVRFFAKGANWIPADTFYNRTTPEHLRHLLGSAREANMNMIRVWGGGVYESEAFYDICDELGLCVWQDFMFACSAYPADEPAFIEEVLEEVSRQVTRLRHRASLVLWCGNNEMEQFCNSEDWPKMPWTLYTRLFDEWIPDCVRSLDTSRPYWPSSPHSPLGDRNDDANPACGDAHLWSVWHGREPFEWYRTTFHRFCSEFGFQSYPEPRTCEAFTLPGDRHITSPVMEHHQRSSEGNAKILHYMLNWFPMPVGFQNTLWLSQIQQGLSIKYAVEHWRRNWPRCAGALYWQLNDIWPIASWSSIDYHGRWKALQYFARRFYAPVLVSALEDADPATASIEFHLSTDYCKETELLLSWDIGDTEGNILEKGEIPVGLRPWQSRLVRQLDLRRYGDDRKARNLLVWYRLEGEDGLVCRDLATLVKPRQLSLRKPRHTWKVHEHGDSWELVLHVDKPALWTWLDLPCHEVTWSDNFVCMQPGHPYRFLTRKQNGLTRAHLEHSLVIRSIFDTYQEPSP